MHTKSEAVSAAPKSWSVPRLRKLGTMRDVAAAQCAPGNGASGNGLAACVS